MWFLYYGHFRVSVINVTAGSHIKICPSIDTTSLRHLSSPTGAQEAPLAVLVKSITVVLLVVGDVSRPKLLNVKLPAGVLIATLDDPSVAGLT